MVTLAVRLDFSMGGSAGRQYAPSEAFNMIYPEIKRAGSQLNLHSAERRRKKHQSVSTPIRIRKDIFYQYKHQI